MANETRQPMPRRGRVPKTGWEKARPIVFGVGIPVIAVIILIFVAVKLFSPPKSIVDDDVFIKSESRKGQIVTYGASDSSKQVGISTPPQLAASMSDSAGSTAVMGTDTAQRTEELLTDSTVRVIDTAATRELREKKLNEEIEQMRNSYRERRQAIINEAVSYLRGTHSERAIKAKAANFRKLADDLRAKVDEFPETNSEYEKALWDAQKEELYKTADFIGRIADNISSTRGEERKMKITASSIESMGVD